MQSAKTVIRALAVLAVFGAVGTAYASGSVSPRMLWLPGESESIEWGHDGARYHSHNWANDDNGSRSVTTWLLAGYYSSVAAYNVYNQKVCAVNDSTVDWSSASDDCSGSPISWQVGVYYY
jgi:hypothetical protein